MLRIGECKPPVLRWERANKERWIRDLDVKLICQTVKSVNVARACFIIPFHINGDTFPLCTYHRLRPCRLGGVLPRDAISHYQWSAGTTAASSRCRAVMTVWCGQRQCGRVWSTVPHDQHGAPARFTIRRSSSLQTMQLHSPERFGELAPSQAVQRWSRGRPRSRDVSLRDDTRRFCYRSHQRAEYRPLNHKCLRRLWMRAAKNAALSSIAVRLRRVRTATAHAQCVRTDSTPHR
ncbi:hypothetical protein J6590_011270 [Homalodisca vitripennis]|nr:hypothetical protein J6590_011270 [Homalodisca vitripennis]